MANLTALLSTLITANHILHYHDVVDAFGHVSVRNPNTNSTFFISLQKAPALVAGPEDIGEYYISNASPVNKNIGTGYAERYIHSEIMKRYPEVNSVIHAHTEAVLPYTITGVNVESTYHMTGFLGDEVSNFDIEDAYPPDAARDFLINTVPLGASLAGYFGTNTSQPTAPLHTVVLQRGHGFSTAGVSIVEAVEWAMYTASNARVQTSAILLANAAGGGGRSVKYLSPRERANCKDMNRWIAAKPWNL